MTDYMPHIHDMKEPNHIAVPSIQEMDDFMPFGANKSGEKRLKQERARQKKTDTQQKKMDKHHAKNPATIHNTTGSRTVHKQSGKAVSHLPPQLIAVYHAQEKTEKKQDDHAAVIGPITCVKVDEEAAYTLLYQRLDLLSEALSRVQVGDSTIPWFDETNPSSEKSLMTFTSLWTKLKSAAKIYDRNAVSNNEMAESHDLPPPSIMKETHQNSRKGKVHCALNYLMRICYFKPFVDGLITIDNQALVADEHVQAHLESLPIAKLPFYQMMYIIAICRSAILISKRVRTQDKSSS